MNPTVRTTRLPDGGIRTHAIADRAMVGRMGRAYYAGTRMIWYVLGPAFIVGPAVWIVVEAVLNGTAIDPIAVCVSPVFGAATFALFRLALLHATGPRQWHLKIPAGTPVYTDVGPRLVAFGHGDTYESIPVEQIDDVQHVASTLVVRSDLVTLVLPDELIPPRARADLLARVENKRQSVAAQPVPMWPGYPSPSAYPFLAPTAPPNPNPNPKRNPLPRTHPDAIGIIRTTAFVEPGLPDRLARASRRSLGTRLALATSPLPLLVIVISALKDGELTWEPVLLGATMTCLAAGLIAYSVFFAAARRARRQYSPGAPISADFGPQAIVIAMGGRVDTVQRNRIRHVQHTAEVFVLTCTNPIGAYVLPDELVPPHIGTELLNRRGQVNPPSPSATRI